MIDIKEIRERLKLLDGNVATLMLEGSSFYIHTPEIEYMLDLIEKLERQLAESVESTIEVSFEKECLERKLKIAETAIVIIKGNTEQYTKEILKHIRGECEKEEIHSYAPQYTGTDVTYKLAPDGEVLCRTEDSND
jgi:hypothetical protein